MCGIAGILGQSDPAALQDMLAVSKHRGPDDWGDYHNDRVSLGMNRLAIQDLSVAGHQPMISPDGRYVIVFNGEVYNFQSLREGLQKEGVIFQSGTDTEVVLNLYMSQGVACLEALRGMFAFVIYDSHAHTIFAARDRLGIKPFYYAHQGGITVFASEIKGMVKSGRVPFALNPDAVYEYLQYGHVQQPMTMVEGVTQLPPGHFLQFALGETPNPQLYWQLPHTKAAISSDIEEVKAKAYGLIDESVRLRMISDRTVGLFLSGGLDSSLILHHMAQQSGSVKAFSVGFAENPYVKNEAEEAKATARHMGAEYQQVVLESREVVESFDDFILGLDQPSVDGLNTYIVSKYAASQMTVALSGLGGDELFAGYTRQVLMAHRFNANRGLKNLASNAISQGLVSGLWGHPLGDLFMKAKATLSADNFAWVYGTGRTSTYPSELKAMVKPRFNPGQRFARYWSDWLADTQGDLAKSLMQLEVQGFMIPQLLRDMDAVSMRHSMEVRFPLIDHKLVEFAYALPIEHKLAPDAPVFHKEGEMSYRAGGTKYLLQQVYEPYLPAGFLDRQKNGFKLPLQLFWDQGLKTQAKDLLPDLKEVLNITSLPTSDFSLSWKLFILASWYRAMKSLNAPNF